MTEKHTPGSWENECGHIWADGWGPVANTIQSFDGREIPDDEWKANANLIAAAPDLLEAFLAAREYMDHIEIEDGGMCFNKWDTSMDCECGYKDTLKQVIAAIAKATGTD